MISLKTYENITSMSSYQDFLKGLTVDEFTTPCSHFLKPSSTIQEAEQLMKQEDIRHLPVLSSDKKVLGILSERDINSSYRLNPSSSLPVEEVMRKNPYCVSPEAKICDVALNMSKNKYGSTLILYEDGSLGIFTSTDALNALVEVVRGEI